MRAIKRINHNAAICEDGNGRQLIAPGRGIGFGDFPHEVSLKDVTRTFYGIDAKYLAFIDEIDPEVLEFAAQLASIVTQQVSYELSPNLPITLADHIQFAIKRAREHLVVSMPLAFDVEQSHPVEYRIAEMALRGIKRTFNVRMPKDEAAGIALSIVNAAVAPGSAAAAAGDRSERLLKQVTGIVEQSLDIKVDTSSFAYARFATHVRYLLDRVSKGKPIDTDNSGLYDVMVAQYPQAAACADEIDQAIEAVYGTALTDEERVYLIMHVNRIAGAETTAD